MSKFVLKSLMMLSILVMCLSVMVSYVTKTHSKEIIDVKTSITLNKQERLSFVEWTTDNKMILTLDNNNAQKQDPVTHIYKIYSLDGAIIKEIEITEQ